MEDQSQSSAPVPEFITHYPAAKPQPQQGIPVVHPKAHKPLYKLLNNMLTKKLPKIKTPRIKTPKVKSWKKKHNYY